ncbi:TniQ family protein [Metabacillus idriensis]|uniref:TniQ family protein n=1 Tax=Metabacillus idriensis TaxID=324768 RepID=UPI00203E1A38|nr:TniQ family protein [Metabacillus idriensis]MCM3597192.1 TniQ family protein [Metabacillus idriensis]
MRPPQFRVEVKENESLYSYLHRTFAANFFDHLGSAFNELGQTVYVTNCNYFDTKQKWSVFLRDYVNLMGVDPFTMFLNKYDEVIFGHPPNRSENRCMYEKYYVKYCQSCIREDFYYRLHWDVSVVSICTKHNQWLLEKCNHCGDPIILSRFMRDTCKCGASYSSADFKGEVPDKITLKIQKKVQKLLLNENARLSICSKNQITIDRHEFFQLFYLFSQLIDNFELKSINHLKMKCESDRVIFLRKNKIRRDTSMMNFIVNHVFLLMTNPDKSLPKIIEYLDSDLISKATRANKYRLLKKVFLKPKGPLYHQIYSEYLNSLTSEYINERVAIKPLKIEKKYLTLGETMEMINTEYKVVLNLCEYGLLSCSTELKQDRLIRLIDKGSIEAYMQMKKKSWSLARASEYLGLNFARTDDLANQGMFDAEHGPALDGYPIWHIKKDSVIQFLQTVIQNCRVIESPDEEGIIFNKATLMTRRISIEPVDLILLIIQRKLNASVLKDRMNFSGLYIRRKDLDEIVFQEKLKRFERFGYTKKEIIKIFGVGQPTVYKWVETILKLKYSETYMTGVKVGYVSKDQIIGLLMIREGWNEQKAKDFLKYKATFL